mmetsp:Transcript_12195/g.25693  ORF Transcript_12195/g.25693 Transcript_12195/m.25693 type:complete len:228 (+) Transcript_12195:1875-2558(+)
MCDSSLCSKATNWESGEIQNPSFRDISSMAMKSARPLTMPLVAVAPSLVPLLLPAVDEDPASCVIRRGGGISPLPLLGSMVVEATYNSFSHTKATIDPSSLMWGSMTAPGSFEESTIRTNSFLFLLSFLLSFLASKAAMVSSGDGASFPSRNTNRSFPIGHNKTFLLALYRKLVMPVSSCRVRSRRSFSSSESVSSCPTPSGGVASSVTASSAPSPAIIPSRTKVRL